mgnify:CR=1 FL=1
MLFKSSPPSGKIGLLAWSLSNGQLTFSWDQACIATNHPRYAHEVGPRLQIYWPRIKIKMDNNLDPAMNRDTTFNREVFISGPTVFRWVWQSYYWGLGAEILGFGLGFDYQAISPHMLMTKDKS